jgi:hypothetical protein
MVKDKIIFHQRRSSIVTYQNHQSLLTKTLCFTLETTEAAPKKTSIFQKRDSIGLFT